MAVYVDEAVWPYGRMLMCHMVADSLAELHQMADRIGVARRHFQCPPKTRLPHYDVCKAKRALALRHDAYPVGPRKIVEIGRQLREELVGRSSEPVSPTGP